MESFYLKVLSGNFIFSIFLKETEISASSGQEEYQSRVQQFTKLGNFEHLSLNVFPTGDIHNATCKFSLEVEIK